MFSLEYCGSCANYVWQIFLRWCCFLPQCQRMCWKWPKNSWEIQFEFLWKRKNWLLKESNSFILMLKEKNESWIHFVTCTRHWQLHRLFFKVDWLTEKMHARDFTVSALHGDMDQKERDVIMREFWSGSSHVLITTDLLTRGIDVQQVSLVINYDLPTNRENYIHRRQ